MKTMKTAAAITAAVITGALMLPTGIATADPCTNSASPYCATSGLPHLGDLPQAPAPEVCSEFYSYTKGHEAGEIVSVPERLIAPARAAGCDIPLGIA